MCSADVERKDQNQSPLRRRPKESEVFYIQRICLSCAELRCRIFFLLNLSEKQTELKAVTSFPKFQKENININTLGTETEIFNSLQLCQKINHHYVKKHIISSFHLITDHESRLLGVGRGERKVIFFPHMLQHMIFITELKEKWYMVAENLKAFYCKFVFCRDLKREVK